MSCVRGSRRFLIILVYIQYIQRPGPCKTLLYLDLTETRNGRSSIPSTSRTEIPELKRNNNVNDVFYMVDILNY